MFVLFMTILDTHGFIFCAIDLNFYKSTLNSQT